MEAIAEGQDRQYICGVRQPEARGETILLKQDQQNQTSVTKMI